MNVRIEGFSVEVIARDDVDCRLNELLRRYLGCCFCIFVKYICILSFQVTPFLCDFPNKILYILPFISPVRYRLTRGPNRN